MQKKNCVPNAPLAIASARASIACLLIFASGVRLSHGELQGPPPPESLVTSFSAFQTVRSASTLGPVYSNGTIFVDTVGGAYRSNISDYLNFDGDWSVYLRICPEHKSFYLPQGKSCEENTPLPGQCMCTKSSHGNCTKWSPFVAPASIPADAMYVGNSSINGCSNAHTWEFFFGPLGSAIDVSVCTMSDTSYIVRTVGARVQTDYTDVITKVPDPSIFSIPQSCGK